MSTAKKRVLFILSLVFIPLISITVWLLWGLPSPRNLTKNLPSASTRILDRHGKLLYEIFSSERRTPIELSQLPKHVVQSHIAAEDRDFYTHFGFSLRGMTRGLWRTVSGKRLEGGSTITQQLVKHALLYQDRTIKRKVRELVLSVMVEAIYSKDQILELYLNEIPYGGTAYGLESASLTYFGKNAKELTLSEASLLAGLPQSPTRFSPFGSTPELAKDRQKYVLNQMLEAGFIDSNQMQQALDSDLSYVPPASIQAPHFSLWVKDLLVQEYGLETVERQGLNVQTTLDLDLQNFAQNTVATEVAKLQKAKVGNGAALVTNPTTGEILAMVGSKDYFNVKEDGNVNVTRAIRQPGSSIKPIIYAAGIDRKVFTAGTILADQPTCFLSPNQKEYCPQNYDLQFHGPTSVRSALGNSFNIPAVKALVANGLSDFVASSSAYGITTYKDPTFYGPSIALGGGELSMLDLSTAFGVLANSGVKTDLDPIIKITDRFGKVLKKREYSEFTPTPKTPLYTYATIDNSPAKISPPSNIRVISPGTAFIISHILYDPGARSQTFGTGSYLDIKNHPEVSVKTGTTNDKRDNWTIGYTPNIVIAVWVGNNDNTPMGSIASGVTGASPIWNKITTQALKDIDQKWQTQPSEVVGATICSQTGLRPTDGQNPNECSPRFEYFLKNTLPDFQPSSIRRDIPIFKPTNSPASSRQISQSPQEIEYRNHLVIFDGLGHQMCLDCPGGFGDYSQVKLDKNGKAL